MSVVVPVLLALHGTARLILWAIEGRWQYLDGADFAVTHILAALCLFVLVIVPSLVGDHLS
jgi:hypothetical protein